MCTYVGRGGILVITQTIILLRKPRSKKEYSLSYAEAEIKQICGAQPFSL